MIGIFYIIEPDGPGCKPGGEYFSHVRLAASLLGGKGESDKKSFLDLQLTGLFSILIKSFLLSPELCYNNKKAAARRRLFVSFV